MDQLKVLFSAQLIALYCMLWGGYLYYDYEYDFKQSPTSPLQQKKQQIDSVKAENEKLQAKIKESQEFYKTLEAKRSELRTLYQQLSEMKGTLTEELDVPSLIKSVVAEAAKTGLKVGSIRPTATQKQSEYYTEQTFDLNFHGVYVQLLLFLERLSNMERIIRVDNFDIKSSGPSNATFVELDGLVQLKAYKYVPSKADTLAQNGGTPAPGSAPMVGNSPDTAVHAPDTAPAPANAPGPAGGGGK